MGGHLYTAEIAWTCQGENFAKGRYSRAHVWRFDGGVEVPASASPSIVPLPHSAADAVDPEEAFVAAIASCHMLTFLDLARRDGFVVDAYSDRAEAVMERMAPGRMGITRVTLRPALTIRATADPDPGKLAELHHLAHEMCFIANSVRCDIVVEAAPVTRIAPDPDAA